MRRRRIKPTVSLDNRSAPTHLREQVSRELGRVYMENVRGVVGEPRAFSQVGIDFRYRNAVVEHQSVGEDAFDRVPTRANRVVAQLRVAFVRPGKSGRRIRDQRAVSREHESGPQCREGFDRLQGPVDRRGAFESQIDPADVVVMQRIADDQQSLNGLEKTEMARRVPRRRDDLPLGFARPDSVARIEGPVDAIRFDWLIEPDGKARLRIARVDRHGIFPSRGNRHAVVLLQLVVAADVIAVPMRVHHDAQALGSQSRRGEFLDKQLEVAPVTGVNEGRMTPSEQNAIRTRKICDEEPAPTGKFQRVQSAPFASLIRSAHVTAAISPRVQVPPETAPGAGALPCCRSSRGGRIMREAVASAGDLLSKSTA